MKPTRTSTLLQTNKPNILIFPPNQHMNQHEQEAAPPIAAAECSPPTTSDPKCLSNEFKESISERLSQLDNLYYPRALLPSTTTPSHRKTLLLELLSRDVAVFLERYGSQLMFEELKGFDVLKGDYEVNWHLCHIRTTMNPTEEEVKFRSTKIKNRRRAYLDKLISKGDYFSEDSMREREPYLHHEYLGRFQDPVGRCMARPGERWSDTLIRQSEEAVILQKIRVEQQRRGVAPSDWVGNERFQQEEEMEEEEEEEEEEEDDDDDDDDDDEEKEEETKDKDLARKGTDSHMDNGCSCTLEASSHDNDAENDNQTATEQPKGRGVGRPRNADHARSFTFVMHQKFLSGEDHEHMDYTEIDENETLDDHWIKEANQDAEEKYFDDV
ncbi:hypothetical protein Leryth_004065 [Lithospermum erythrorhizon]|nr:hypothetical protein Leryth_004065 [Lithospermum erythrorhizon]